jgi:acyl-coenzyme A synthetase/AMP-(fatty) acid ligase
MQLVERLVGKHVAAGAGDTPCYADPDVGEVTYARLYEAARGYAAVLRHLGVAAGTRALVVADDSVATVVAVLGLWWHGSVPVPVSPLLSLPEIRFMAEDCAAGFVHLDLTGPKFPALEAEFASLPALTGERLRAAMTGGAELGAGWPYQAPEQADRPSDEAVLIQYTSGSTGAPKGVLHSAAGVKAVLSGIGSLVRLRPDDVVLSTAKLTFGYGFGNSVLLPLAAGARAVLLRGSVDAHVVCDALRTHRPTVLFSVPRMYAALLTCAGSQGTDAFGSIRLAVTAGEHCPGNLAERIQDTLGLKLVNGLGATEVLHIVVATPPGRPATGAIGRPVPGVTVTVRDEHGLPVPDDAEGRLHIAGPSVALGYLNRDDATRQTFAEGGAYTSDIVRRTEDGDIDHLCRADDVLNLGGYKVAPAEIEAVVSAAGKVAECVVVAAQDENGLEHAVAYAVPEAGEDPAAVRRGILVALRTQLAPFKRPARVELIDRLPVTSTGKLARHQLRETVGRR